MHQVSKLKNKMPTLEEIKAQKLARLQQKQYARAMEQQINLQQQIEAIEATAKQHMDSAAIARYGNLKTAHPEKALKAAILIVQAVQSGQLTKKITDAEFKELLLNIMPEQREFKFKFS